MSVLSQSAKKEIDHWCQKFPDDKRQSAVLAALRIVQEEHGGWLKEEHLDSIAEYLKIPKIAVYEVASFYTLYHLKPMGKYRLYVCTNISCMLCGSDTIVDHLKSKLGIGFGETTPDNKFSLVEVECLAACGGAPAMQVNKDYHENLTPQSIDALLAGLA